MSFSNSDACLKKALAILTPEQRKQYEKMRGKAFDFKNILKDFDDAKEAHRLEMQKAAAAPEATYSSVPAMPRRRLPRP